jgi:hypothetical protein
MLFQSFLSDAQSASDRPHKFATSWIEGGSFSFDVLKTRDRCDVPAR